MAGLYRLSSLDPAVQARLEGQPGNRTAIRIWGEVRSKAKPVTGTLVGSTGSKLLVVFELFVTRWLHEVIKLLQPGHRLATGVAYTLDQCIDDEGPWLSRPYPAQ